MSNDLPVGISYSGGSSSEWMIEAVIQGVLPRPEHVAVFSADTGAEHEWTYEAMIQVEDRCRTAGIPFYRVRHEPETLEQHLLAIRDEQRTRAEHPPLWVAKDGGGRGQIGHRCTYLFKVAPMRRAMSTWLKSIGKPKKIMQWVGFAKDEAHRATKAVARQDVQWGKLDFPAIRLGMGRVEQRAQLEKWTGRAPRFSMCRECPFKTPERWRQTSESDLQMAFEVDEAIRDLSGIGITEGDAYVSDRLIPVEQLVRKGDPQPHLPGFEPAGCDAGACFL